MQMETSPSCGPRVSSTFMAPSRSLPHARQWFIFVRCSLNSGIGQPPFDALDLPFELRKGKLIAFADLSEQRNAAINRCLHFLASRSPALSEPIHPLDVIRTTQSLRAHLEQ